MKKITLPLIMMFIPLLLMAQKSREEMGGVYHAYPIAEKQQATDYAAQLKALGYTPFFISHYGRHGSRWMTSDERYLWIQRHFDDRDNLTDTGRSVARRVRKAVKNAMDNGGQLTSLGQSQHRGIARRMAMIFPEVFADGARVRVRSSVVKRCIDSRDAFLSVMKRSFPGAQYDIRVDTADMAWMAYTTPELKKYEQTCTVPLGVKPDRLMKALFVNPSRISDKEKLMTELHTLASDMQDIPLRISFDDVFTDHEFEAIYDKNNRRMFMTSGGSADNGGLTQLSAVSLWQDIKADADSVITASCHGATLRFGHDTNLYRMMTLIGLLDGQHKDKNGTDLMDEIIPMAANMQMVFVRDAKARVLVAVYHNEHQAGFKGLDAYPGGVYLWDDVKQHVERRIKAALRLAGRDSEAEQR